MKSKNNNYSLLILKPDFLELNLFCELERLIAKERLVVVGTSNITMDLEFVKKLYQWEELLYPLELKEYLCSSSMPVWILSGKNAIIKTLSIKRLLRKKYSRDQLHTLIHCSDTSNDFFREYRLINQKNGVIMKTNNQVELIVFRSEPGLGFRCLMLKRNQKKGGFWQPITGNVEIGENFEQAAVRELKEETKITKFLRIFDTGYSFDFFDDGRLQHEKVFAVEVSVETKISLSDEHVDFVWATKDDCLNKFLKYPGNIAGLKVLYKKLEDNNE